MWLTRLIVIFGLLLHSSPLQSAYTFKNGWFVNTNELPTMSAREHFEAGVAAYESQDWGEAAVHFTVIIVNFSQTPFGSDARFFLGVCYFQFEEYDLANEAFSEYLRSTNNPKYFQQAVYYKFCIAEQFRCGAKRRYFGTRQLPKWACGKELALKIYDEVIAAMPSNELAAQALFSKACLLWEQKNFRCAVESFQLIIKRFPKHELAPESYLMINRVYMQQLQYEFQNPDILAFAQINLRRFKHDFPGDERVCEAEADVQYIKEIYAGGLFETGDFYERICKPRAAMIYFFSTVNEFPDTEVARAAGNRLSGLDPSFDFDLYMESRAREQAEAEAKAAEARAARQSQRIQKTEEDPQLQDELDEIYDFDDE